MSPDRLTASLLTPPGRGGIAVIALHGPAARDVLDDLFTPRQGPIQSGRLHLGELADPVGVIDEAIVTGQGDRWALNLHGGPVGVRAVLRRLEQLGAAVESGGGDPFFTTAHPQWANPAVGSEMLALLPRCRSERAVQLVTRQWSAGLSEWVHTLLEQPAPLSTSQSLRQAADRLEWIERVLDPPEIVLAGAPNAGKSTLANDLVGRAVSIVHDQAGTTRDWVREMASLDGWAVWLTDTAGLWEQADHPIDRQAVERAWHRIARADLVLLCSAGEPIVLPERIQPDRILSAATRCDQFPPHGQADVAVSSHTGLGRQELIDAIHRTLGLDRIEPSAPTALTGRQADCLNRAADAVDGDNRSAMQAALRELLGQ